MNREDFEQMAIPLRKRIISMISRLSDNSDSEIADDVAQDTMLKLWTIRDKLDEYSSVESLAMVIARNRFIDIMRSSHGVTMCLDLVADIEQTQSPEECIIENDRRNELLDIISSLPSVQQSVIRMRHIEGLEIAEIASITGSTTGSIRSALSRARQNIKEIFMQKQ